MLSSISRITRQFSKCVQSLTGLEQPQSSLLFIVLILTDDFDRGQQISVFPWELCRRSPTCLLGIPLVDIRRHRV